MNKSLDGDNDPLNALSDKVTRGKAKAFLVKIKRGSAERPAMPDLSQAAPASVQSNAELSQEQTIALVVNNSLDGNNDPLNAIEDKVTRGKAKALLVKIKRGSAEVPPMPNIPRSKKTPANEKKTETEDEMIERLVAVGLGGDMEEINALESRVLRGKIKAAIVKAKRKK